MNLNEYRVLAQRTSKHHGKDQIKNGAMGLIGESGEVMDVLKKHLFQSTENAPFPYEKLADELGDVMWYAAEFATGYGLSLMDVYSVGMILYSESDSDDLIASKITAHGVFLYSDLYDNLRKFDSQIEAAHVFHNLGSIIHSVEALAKRKGFRLDEILERNIQKLMKRYPNGFDPERSMQRSE